MPYFANSMNGQSLCYNGKTNKWEPCKQGAKPIAGRGAGTVVPPSCCITPAMACCLSCTDLFGLAKCVDTALVLTAIPQAPFDTLDIDALQTLLNDISGSCGWSLTGGPNGVNPFGLRDLNTGQKLCVVNVTLTNSGYTLNNPGDSIVQCLEIRNDCNGGGGINIGICWEVSIVDYGIPAEWVVEYNLFRLCTNPIGLDEIVNCTNCYA